MRKIAVVLAAVAALLLAVGRAEEVGIKTVTETAQDGTILVHNVVFTGTEYVTLNTLAQPPHRFPGDTGMLWVDRNHRYAIAQSVTIQGDGMGIFANWDLNNQRAAYYRTLGQNVPAWESPGIFNWAYGGHQIGASRWGEALTLAANDKVKEWSKLSGAPRWSWSYPNPGLALAKTNSYGTRVAVATSAGRLYVLDAQTGDTAWTTSFPEGNRLQGVAITCDGAIVAVTVYDSCFVFENGARRGAVPIGTTSSGTQFAAKMNTDGKYLVTGDYNGFVRLYRWSGSSYDPMWGAHIGNPWVTDVSISKDGSTIAAGTGYSSGIAAVFDSSSATPLWTYQGYGNFGAYIASCALSRYGERIAFASWGDTAQSGSFCVLTVQDRGSATPLTGVTRDQEPGSLFACDISGDGKYVAAGGKAVHAYRMGNGGEVYSFLIGATPASNVGVASIQAPGPYVQVGNSVIPSAMVFNYGDSTVSFPVLLNIKSPQGVVATDSAFVTSLAPQVSRSVTFGTWAPAAYNFYDFVFWTNLPGDQYRPDDTLVLDAKCFHDAYPGAIVAPFAEMTVGYSFASVIKVWNNGSYTDDISVNLNILDSLGNPLFTSGQTVTSVDPGDSAMVTLANWQAPYAGRYQAKASAATTTDDFIPANDSLAKPFAGSWEIMYDDGVPEAYYWVGRQNNDKFYVRFTPTAPAPFTITQGRIYVNLANQPFAYVAICKDEAGRPDTATEYQRVANVMTPTAPAWITFDLNVARTDNSDLWLVANWPDNSPGLGVGSDAAQPRDFRSYFSSNVDTFYQWQAHDWMMRITQRPEGTGLAQENGAPGLKFALGPGHPNPFRGATAIRYSLAAESRVAVRIFDPTGREIRTLVDAAQKAGEYRTFWDGSDRTGKPAASGIYFCRMEVAGTGFAAAHKLMLLR